MRKNVIGRRSIQTHLHTLRVFVDSTLYLRYPLEIIIAPYEIIGRNQREEECVPILPLEFTETGVSSYYKCQQIEFNQFYEWKRFWLWIPVIWILIIIMSFIFQTRAVRAVRSTHLFFCFQIYVFHRGTSNSGKLISMESISLIDIKYFYYPLRSNFCAASAKR